MTFDDDDVKPVHSDAEILARVYARGRAMRRRKRAVRAGAVVLALGLLTAGGIGVGNLVATTKKHAAPALGPPSAPSSSYAPTRPLASPTTTNKARAVSSPSVSPTPSARVCLNSFDPACGKFYWYPNPGPNAPVTITIHLSKTTVQVGETITATVSVRDPDAPILCANFEWGDNGTYISTAIRERARFGRWDTPPKHPTQQTLTFTHKYQNPGPHHVLYSVYSGTGGCGDVGADPYASEGSATANLTVEQPSPTPSPSTSPSY